MFRILLLNTDYPAFLSWLYRSRPTLALRSFERQLALRNRSLFGTADFMSHHLAALGHAAIDVHANNRPLQEAWMAQQGEGGGLRRLLHRRPLQLPPDEPRFYDILAAQVRAFRPDIIYNHDISSIPAVRLDAIKPSGCRLVAQIAAPLDPGIEWRYYALVISSLPNYVASFARQGIPAAYLPLAFDARVREHVRIATRDIGFSFVGSLFPAHAERRVLLEKVAARTAIEIWGQGAEALPRASAIRARYKAAAWGRAMYEVLARSRLSLNKHIDISENYANNMRLFEATGVGTLLLTDWKENLAELFEPKAEVVAYRSAEECVDLADYYLRHDGERERIAAAGMARCLRDHSYQLRMMQLTKLLEQRLG